MKDFPYLNETGIKPRVLYIQKILKLIKTSECSIQVQSKLNPKYHKVFLLLLILLHLRCND